MAKGYLAFVLHAHLPYVRDLDQDDSLEQIWLYEAITETYIPLCLMLDNLIRDGVDFRLTFSITPTLAAMLADPLLQSRYVARLDRLIELTHSEIRRTRDDPNLAPLAQMYSRRFAEVRDAFVNRYQKDLLGAFSRFQDLGCIEIMASAATHGYLPLLSVVPSAVRAQVGVGVECYRRVFGSAPYGFWLPECGYFPGVDEVLAEHGIRYTVLETHGITRANERPRYGVYAPLYCSSGLAAFGRDPESSRQVWSSEEGYPGDFDYREFYRDIGQNTGIKYYRVTGKTDHKAPYAPERAEQKTEIHAHHFLETRIRQVERLAGLMDRKPVVVAPYDAELFGHWWYEGPTWLERVIRKIDANRSAIRLITLSEYLSEYPVNQTAEPCLSSWGYGGFNQVWLNERTDWIYPRLHEAARAMERLTKRTRGGASPAVNQAANELLLAQASDWAFMINAGAMKKFAERRVEDHLSSFERLRKGIENGDVDPEWLAARRRRNAVFADIPTAQFFQATAVPGSSKSAPTLAGGPGPAPRKSPRPLHITMISPEIVGFAKTGGLADMVGSLAMTLARLGHRVSMIMPAYRQVLRSGLPIRESGIRFTTAIAGVRVDANVLIGSVGGAPVYLIRADRYFDREYLYGAPEGDYGDNAERFAFFNRAALELLRETGVPDVLHAHDWQTAAAIVFLKTQPERYPGLANVRTVFTVHNLGYQGLFPPDQWRFLDIDWSFFTPRWLEFYGKINLLKGALTFADAITTVSARYAEEILTPDYGFGLEGVLQQRTGDLVGILNGVDYEIWNPVSDPFLIENYGIDNIEGKRACKADVQRLFGLEPSPSIPLIGIVSRLAAQKGMDLVQAALDRLLERDLQIVLLGSGDKAYQEFFESAARRRPDRLAVCIGFEERLAHKIEAGADMFLMPSRYEPSGLNQLYSMKYGTIPIARATGGLKDSVEEYDPARGTGVGFLFERYDGGALLDAVDRALRLYHSRGDWTKLMRNAMAADFSWDRSAREYVRVYQKVLTGASTL